MFVSGQLEDSKLNERPYVVLQNQNLGKGYIRMGSQPQPYVTNVRRRQMQSAPINNSDVEMIRYRRSYVSLSCPETELCMLKHVEHYSAVFKL